MWLSKKEEKGDNSQKVYKKTQAQQGYLNTRCTFGLSSFSSFLSLFFSLWCGWADTRLTSCCSPVRFTTRVETTSQEAAACQQRPVFDERVY